MSAAVRDVELVQTREQPLPAVAADAGPVATFERLAKDPNVDVEKLERLMAMHERLLARGAQEQFNIAMTAAQTDMRPVAADANNPQTKSRYASYGALDHALRPIYTRHGFGLSFDTGDSPLGEHVRVLCYVSHVAGHSRTYHVDMPADGKGAKGGDVMTKTHAVGAAMSYGMRYLLKMVFNVAVGEDDRDGNAVTPTAVQSAPAGYSDWLLDMAAVADEGLAKLQVAWQQSKPEYRTYTAKHNAAEWAGLKAKAGKVGER